jgi:probable selenium-dependent hydroxylase accessory protein YqeC
MALFVPALGIEPGETVAVIGGGGKVPLLARLAHEWASAGGKPLLTTTTKIFSFEAPADYLVLDVKGPDADAVSRAVRGRGRPGVVTLLGSGEGRDALVRGIEPGLIARAALELPADLVLVKADGSRGRSLKAHKEYEPVVPSNTSLVIAVAGVDVWGLALTPDTVHRAELFGESWGFGPDEVLDDDAFIQPLGDPQGYRRCVPPNARYAVLLNKADENSRQKTAHRLAGKLAARGVSAFWGDVKQGRIESGEKTPGG